MRKCKSHTRSLLACQLFVAVSMLAVKKDRTVKGAMTTVGRLKYE